MSYENIVQKFQKDEVVLLDGGTGTELQKRGLDMVPGAWCGPVSLKNADVLEKVHLDYIEAGADIITANTYASSRIMLREAGYEDQFEEINRVAIETALRARDKSGQKSILVAGSLWSRFLREPTVLRKHLPRPILWRRRLKSWQCFTKNWDAI